MLSKLFSLQRATKPVDTWTVIPKPLLNRENNPANRFHKNNLIKTTKYTMWNFLPKNLFEQFHRFANLYFLFIIVLNFIPQINAFGKEISMIPLIFVLAVTAIKDLVEDRQRYMSDKCVNNRLCWVYDTVEKEEREKKWRTIEVGDVIRLNNNDIIPSDILLLSTSDEDGLCHISTANLDGENNLKQKKLPKGFLDDNSTWGVDKISFQVTCDLPNNHIHKFVGRLVQQNGEEIPVNQSNLLLRGCVLKNTEYVYGLVIYAGHDTKSMLNDSGTRYKRTQVEKDINKDVIACVFILFAFCLIGAIFTGYWTKKHERFEKDLSVDKAEASAAYEGFLRFWTFIIILQVIIPISLYVSVEIVKLGQVFFINHDSEMFYQETSQYKVCRATNINEDLGQIKYIFSDKTGTLTENKMVFKRFSILGNNYLHPEDESEEGPSLLYHQLHESFCVQNNHKGFQVWDDFFTTLAISNTVVVSKQPDARESPIFSTKYNPMDSKSLANGSIPENGTFIIPENSTLSVPAENNSTGLKQNGLSYSTGSTLTVPGTAFGTPVSDHTDLNKTSENCNTLNDSCEYRAPVRPSMYSRPLSDRLSKSIESISSWLDCGLVPVYEYESPDEGALVKAASCYGYMLANRTPEQIFFTNSNGEIRIFDILHVLAFDSVRKRMSIIVRDDKGKLKVYCKGADNEILTQLKHGQDELQIATVKHLEEFAEEGLRTLCIAVRELSKEEYDTWKEKHVEAELALEDRDQKLSDSASLIETELTLLGATGIEDKLQDGVPETIAGLRNAGINLWILTGDKQETAVNIGFSSKVLDSKMDIIKINHRTKETCCEHLDEILKNLNRKWPSVTVLPGSTGGLRNDAHERPSMAIIIDGITLEFARNPPLSTKFIEIAKHCESVICCRAAPLQKAAVVRLVRDHLKVMTLAIGDGANDVSMLQMAEIGVGIAGQEGIQAVMASDFVLGRFKFLTRLLLLHGFWCYDRVTRMILYFFYKNTMFIGVLFWFQIYNGFSGSNAIDDVSLILFNLLFTSIPPIICGIWDQCLPEDTVLMKPILYQLGQRGKLYTRRLFWINILDSIFQSVILFFVPYLTFSDLPLEMLAAGVLFHQLAVLTANLHIGIETPNWTYIHAIVIIGSVIVSYLYYFVYCALSPYMNIYYSIFNVMSLPEFWFLTILCPVFAILPRLLVRVLQTMFQPSVLQQVRQYVRRKDIVTSSESTKLRTLSESSPCQGGIDDDEDSSSSSPTKTFPQLKEHTTLSSSSRERREEEYLQPAAPT